MCLCDSRWLCAYVIAGGYAYAYVIASGCVVSLLNAHCSWAHVLCLEVILKKKTFFKLPVRTHDLGHMTETMLATARHNHSTISPLTISNIIFNIACHRSA